MRLPEVLWPSMDRLLDSWFLKLEGKKFTFFFIDLTLNLEHNWSKTIIQNLQFFQFLCH